MFQKYGEFGSYEEINAMAQKLKEAGEEDSLMSLAEENGIDREDAEDFYDGAIEELTTATLAAIGKLRVEKGEYKITGILEDWVAEIEEEITGDIQMAKAVRSKGRTLAGYIAKTAEYGYANKAVVDKRIVELCPKIKKVIGSHEFAIGIPDKHQRRKLMREYYMEEKA